MDEQRKRAYLKRLDDLAEEAERIKVAYEEASAVYARRLEALNKRMARNVENVKLLAYGVDRDTKKEDQ